MLQTGWKLFDSTFPINCCPGTLARGLEDHSKWFLFFIHNWWPVSQTSPLFACTLRIWGMNESKKRDAIWCMWEGPGYWHHPPHHKGIEIPAVGMNRMTHSFGDVFWFWEELATSISTIKSLTWLQLCANPLEGRTPLLLPFSFRSPQPSTSFWGRLRRGSSSQIIHFPLGIWFL